MEPVRATRFQAMLNVYRIAKLFGDLVVVAGRGGGGGGGASRSNVFFAN